MVIADLLGDSNDLYQLAKKAIESGDQKRLIELKEAGLNLKDESLLVFAISSNQSKIVKFLLEEKIDIRNMNISIEKATKNGKLHDEVRVNMTDAMKYPGLKISNNAYETLEKLRKRSKEINALIPNDKEITFEKEVIEFKNVKEENQLQKELEPYNQYPYSASNTSHLYIPLLDENQRVEPEILEKRKQLAKDLGYGLSNASDYPFDRTNPSYYKQLASSHIFASYNTTLQKASSQGIIFEWVLKKIYDLSELVKNNNGDFVASDYENHPIYQNLFKASSLPKFQSKSDLMLYATNYYYNNFDAIKHLFLEENKENIQKNIIEDLKLIQLEESKEKINRLTTQFITHLQVYYHDEKSEQVVYRLSNEKEKVYYNSYMDNLLLSIMKEDPKLLSSNLYTTILSSMISVDTPLVNERKQNIDFLINTANLSPQKSKAFYSTLLDYAKEEGNFNTYLMKTSNLGDTLEYILKQHLTPNTLSMNDIKKFPAFLSFLKNNTIQNVWKEKIFNSIDYNSFDSTEKTPLIAELLVDYSIPEYLKGSFDSNLNVRQKLNTEATFQFFWDKFKDDMSEFTINSILKKAMKVNSYEDVMASSKLLNHMLDNPPKNMSMEHINIMADFLFDIYNLPQFNSDLHDLVDKVFSHPLYTQAKNKDKIAEHYYYNLDTLLNHSQLIDRNLSNEQKLKTIQGIIDNPNNYPNFQYTLNIFKSLYKNNQTIVDDTFYKKYNSLTFLVNTLKEQAICTPFLEAYLSINQDLQWLNGVDKNNKKPVEYVKRRKNIAEERVCDLLLNHGATVELSAFNKLMISFSSLFKSEISKDFEYVESVETQVHNKYDLLLEEVGHLSKNGEKLLSQYHPSFSDTEFDMIANRIQSIYQNAIKIIDIAKKDEGLIEPDKLFYLENTITKYLPESFNAFTSGMKSTEILDANEKDEKVQYLIKELSQQVSILSMKTTTISKEYVNEIVESKMLDSAKHTQFLKAKS